MKSFKERLSLFLMVIVFVLLCPVRYHAGQFALTLLDTLNEVLPIMAIVTGATICIVYFIQRVVGERLPWDRILRIFLATGIFLNLFIALYYFLSRIQENQG